MLESARLRFFLYLLLFVLFSFPVLADGTRHVLILNSYHEGYKWTDDETHGVIEGIGATSGDVKFYIEYMGTKWAFDKEYFGLLRDTYTRKYRDINFDVIIATDNDAFNFLRTYRDTVFGRVPSVFCGVNWFQPEDLEKQSLFTGVNEDADIAATFDVMLKLHPKTKHIYVVIDSTTTGQRVHENLLQIIPRYQRRVMVHMIENMSMGAILNTVSKLSDDSLVLITVFQKDTEGTFFEFSESTGLISKNSKVPVYGIWDFNLGFGIVGGMLTSGYSQGFRAGELASRILKGEPVNSIPVLMQSPNRYMFDYRELTRFRIDDSALPPDSVIINRPPSFYAINKGFVWVVIIGSVVATIVILTLSFNIRQRAHAEKALRESEEKYHTLVDNLSIGVYRNAGHLNNGKFIQANPAMVRIYGYDSLDEFLDVPVSDLYQNPADRNLFLDELTRNGFVKDRELAMQKKDGTPIWVLCSANAMFDEHRQIKWVDGVNEDVTERKLLEVQLRQAQKMEAIGTLAGGVAHDFNNILTAIIGYGNLLRMKIEQDQSLRYYLDPILSSAEKAAQLTQSLLAFSRKQVIQLVPVSLNDIVDGMGKLLLRVIGEDVDLQIQHHNGDLLVLADRSQIEQVILNLVTNARDAMPEGGTISIETDRIELSKALLIKHEFMRPGDYAVISVSDTGSGMNEEIRSRIFEPFFSTKTVGKGTGLGLSIVYGIVKQHNGDLSVYSESGKGSTFKIYLPLADDSILKGEGYSAEAPAVGGTETILIGEDNDEVRRLARDILTYGGYTVILARDGEDALVKFWENADRIDMLLLDVVMPKRNGKEVYDEVRRLKPGTRVLFMSGYTANIIHKKGVLEEGLNFIPKPLSPDRLLRKVREVLSQKEA